MNKGRVQAIELMKAIAIIGMVFVHVLEGSLNFFDDSAWVLPGSIPYTLIEFLGGIPAAGVFTFAMGWGAAFSKNATVNSYLKRALKIGLLLFYVNLMYAILPGLLNPEVFGRFSEHPWAIIGFNIYSYASIFMLFFALMKKLQNNTKAKAAISIAAVAAILIVDITVAPESFTTGNGWLDTLIGIFVRENHYSWFPLVPWGIFPIMGYWAAILYKKWDDSKKFALTNLVTGIVLTAISLIVIKTNEIPMAAANPGWVNEIDYYYLTIWNVICAVGMICLETALAFGIMALTKNKLHPILANMSHNVMEMFVAHWIFVGPMLAVLNKVTNVWVNALIGLITFIATYFLVEAWNKFIKPKTATK